MNYVVKYVTKNGTEETKYFATKDEAINFYKSNMKDMAYGYVSDIEALSVAEEVKNEYEEQIMETEQNVMYDFLAQFAN